MTLTLSSHVSGHYTFIRRATITDNIELEYYVQHKDARVVLDQFTLSTEEFYQLLKSVETVKALDEFFHVKEAGK